MSTVTLPRQAWRLVYDAIVAGVIAGIVTDAFLFATRASPFPTAYNFVASTLVGNVAYTSSAYLALGVLMHFVISAGWGALYGVAAQRFRQLLAHPLISGLVFGLIVLVGMQLILVAAGAWKAPASVMSFVNTLLSHTVFFAMPIAWYVSRAAQQRGELASR